MPVQWEYLILYIGENDAVHNTYPEDKLAHLLEEDSYPWERNVIPKLGEEGWELVSYSQAKSILGDYKAIFKRHVPIEWQYMSEVCFTEPAGYINHYAQNGWEYVDSLVRANSSGWSDVYLNFRRPRGKTAAGDGQQTEGLKSEPPIG